MSKDINVNDTVYTGISVVEIFTADKSETVTFKDTDEITVPAGTKEITSNGTYDVSEFASALVNVPTEGGGTVLETQIVSCQTALGTYGGISFDCITSGKAVYIGTTDTEINSTNRNPHRIIVNIDYDTGYNGCFFIGYTGAKTTAEISVENGVCTINGASAVRLKDGTNYTFTKVSL